MGHSKEVEVALQTGGFGFRSGLRFSLDLAKFFGFRFFLWIEGGEGGGTLRWGGELFRGYKRSVDSGEWADPEIDSLRASGC